MLSVPRSSLILIKNPKKWETPIAMEMPRVQVACMTMDPNNSTPPSEFMNELKTRMSVYYANTDKKEGLRLTKGCSA